MGAVGAKTLWIVDVGQTPWQKDPLLRVYASRMDCWLRRRTVLNSWMAHVGASGETFTVLLHKLEASAKRIETLLYPQVSSIPRSFLKSSWLESRHGSLLIAALQSLRIYSSVSAAPFHFARLYFSRNRSTNSYLASTHIPWASKQPQKIRP